MGWRVARLAFPGGTPAARELAGRRVRTRRALHGWPLYRGETGDAGTTDIPAGRIGLVGHVPPDALDRIVIAFPKSGQEPPPSLRRLARSVPFFSIRVNWPTFREHFDIDA